MTNAKKLAEILAAVRLPDAETSDILKVIEATTTLGNLDRNALMQYLLVRQNERIIALLEEIVGAADSIDREIYSERHG